MSKEGSDVWMPRFGEESRAYCDGFVDAFLLHHPHLAIRIVRVQDGRVVRFADAVKTASVGLVAGFPTAAQYIDAAVAMLHKAVGVLSSRRTASDATDDKVGILWSWIEASKNIREGL